MTKSAEYLFEHYISLIDNLIKNGKDVGEITFTILDKEGIKYAEAYEMADKLDDLILARTEEV